MTDYQETDEKLKALILRLLPTHDSYGAAVHITANKCDTDIGKLVLQRALLNIDKAAEAYYDKRKIYIPYMLDSYEAARLTTLYDGTYTLQSTSNIRCMDLDFQVHKHVMVQTVLFNICRLIDEEDETLASIAVCDGVKPFQYGAIYRTTPPISNLNIINNTNDVPVYIISNLYDSNESVTSLFYKLSLKIDSGSEMIIIMPYDIKMWTLYRANVSEGSYSFEWKTLKYNEIDDECKQSTNLPPAFFESAMDPSFVLHIRPYNSNKTFHISIIDFLRVNAKGDGEGLYKETRRISHGFAEISIIAFRPVHSKPVSVTYNTKRMNLPYGKRIIVRNNIGSLSKEFAPDVSKSIESPMEYIIDNSVYNRAIKAAIQIRLTRNYILPVIYHLFAYSTHIVFNGSIVTLQKVMNPEVMCQVTESILNDIVPIKIRLLQSSKLVQINENLKVPQLLKGAASYIAANLIDKASSIDELSYSSICRILRNPQSFSIGMTKEDASNTLCSVIE